MNAEGHQAKRIRDACETNHCVIKVKDREYLDRMEALNRDRQRREAEGR